MAESQLIKHVNLLRNMRSERRSGEDRRNEGQFPRTIKKPWRDRKGQNYACLNQKSFYGEAGTDRKTGRRIRRGSADSNKPNFGEGGLKGRQSIVTVDNGKHETSGPRSQDIDEIFVDFHRFLTEEPRIHAASSSQTMRRAGCQTTNKPHTDHLKPSSGQNAPSI